MGHGDGNEDDMLNWLSESGLERIHEKQCYH